MHIGCPKEIKPQEFRIGLTPTLAQDLVARGHIVNIETGAGLGAGFSDAAYFQAGAELVETAAEVFAQSEMIVKVKEPQPHECRQLRPGQVLFTYLHLAADPQQAQLLMDSGATCVAYETITSPQGGLPLLAPMSLVAGRLSVQAGAHHMEIHQGGNGMLLGGVPGVLPAKGAVIGGGVVGFNAAQMAAGLGADVTILDRSPEVLEKLGMYFEARAKTRFSNKANLAECVAEADLVIGAVLIPGAAAPKLVTADMLKTMKKGAVLVDVAIDQGGCFETSRATTHAEPTYVVDDVVHYCVANMPGAVARTSTYALNNVTLPHALRIADLGWKEALRRDPHLRAGLNVWDGKVTYQAVADDLGLPYTPAQDAIA